MPAYISSTRLRSRNSVLKNENINPETGETNALALIICRGTGECDLNFSDPEVVSKWTNYVICQHHVDELLYLWGNVTGFRRSHVYRNALHLGDDAVCSMPEGVGKHHKRRPGPHHLVTLTIEEANIVNKQLGYLVHPGIRMRLEKN